MNVDTLMTRGLVTVAADATVQRVRELFAAHAFHHLLVLEGDKLAGIITDRDLLANISPFVGKPTERTQDHFLLERRAHQIMSRDTVVCAPEMPIKLALGQMLVARASCVVVCDESHRPLGIVTWHDLLGYLMECGVEPGCTLTKQLSEPRSDAPREQGSSGQITPFI